MIPPIFHAADFAGHEGEVFLVGAPEPLPLTLTSVRTWGPTMPDGQRQPFSLVLHGPLAPYLPAAIHPFEHPTLGSFELFIVPNGPDNGAMSYQVVFA